MSLSDVVVDGSTSREWSDLPGPPLETIARHLLPAHRDLCAVTSVCRSWRSHLRSILPSLLPSLPPLLLTLSSADTFYSDSDDPSDPSSSDENNDHSDPPSGTANPIVYPSYPSEEEEEEEKDYQPPDPTSDDDNNDDPADPSPSPSSSSDDDDTIRPSPPSSVPPMIPFRLFSPAVPGLAFCPTPRIPPFPRFAPRISSTNPRIPPCLRFAPHSSSTTPHFLRFLSFSRGYLLYLPCCPPLRPTLVNVITNYRILLPPLHPSHNRFRSYYATLTAPPSDPSSRFLLFFSNSTFVSCQISPSPGAATWTLHLYSSDISYIIHVVTFKNRFLGLNDSARLLELDLSSDQTHCAVHFLDKLKPPRTPLEFDTWSFGPQLVCSSDQVYLILFLASQHSNSLLSAYLSMPGRPMRETGIYSLDWKRHEWVEVKRLQDSAIFIDCVGKAPVFCEKPERWGGQSNTLYIAGSGQHKWMRCPLHKKIISRIRTTIVCNTIQYTWPSPIWIHPSFLYG